jgi:tRNA G37 N-methylase TrmD
MMVLLTWKDCPQKAEVQMVSIKQDAIWVSPGRSFVLGSGGVAAMCLVILILRASEGLLSYECQLAEC